ncbi:MAG: transcription antitermination factor NusB [Lachnospiraceae bacterium]|nr:transcription antitermination factor NusB [Lachnospiraceae bacterium]
MKRSEMREQVFKQLFLMDFYNREDFGEQCRLYLETQGQSEEDDQPKMTEDDQQVLCARAQAIAGKVEELDARINEVSVGWKTARMNRTDLAILRLAAYEILFDDDIPDKVAINEAVELAKQYGEDESYSFINGVLGQIVANKDKETEQ